MTPSRWISVLAAVWLMAGVCRADDYRVGPGDVLEITVYGEKELSKEYEVNADGSMRFPWIRNIEVTGLTTREIEDRLESLLSPDYLVDPQISVVVKKFESKKVYVLGAVKNPGLYGLKGPTNLLEAISMAGGISDLGGKSFTLIRGGDIEGDESVKKLVEAKGSEESIEDFTRERSQVRVFRIDGYKLLDQGDLSQNMTMEDGDIVSVNKAQLVYFDGEVKKPGPVPYEEGLTLMRAISMAGGLTNLAGNRVHITRVRDGRKETIKVSLRELAKPKTPDMPVFPEDVILVKRSLF